MKKRSPQTRAGVHAGLAVVLGLLVVGGAGCRSMHSHVNRPLEGNQVWPDCRATTQIERARGQEDVMVILCLSGGGSRAAWFSAATMLRLERVVDEINLLQEVDVISAVSGGGLPAAYYCSTRDPGPYSVVRVEQLPRVLPAELAGSIKMDRARGLLGVRGKMSLVERDQLLPLFASASDRASVERLHWLSHHTRAPALWQPKEVRDLMTRDYINGLLDASFSPLNCREHWLYWTTGYDRSDQMARIFTRNIYGAELVHVPERCRQAAELEFLGWLDRPARTGTEPEEVVPLDVEPQALRWPKEEPVQVPLRLDWIPGYSPMRRSAQFMAHDVMVDGLERVTRRFRRILPYRFKDLNPERPYLILNATNGTEDDPGESHYGEVFTFTREEFKDLLDSSIDDYPLAWGVMASAAFPGVFSFVTLRDFRPAGTNSSPRYMHVFDGGNSDNLGLRSAKKIILANRDRYRHFVVLLVDAHAKGQGAGRAEPDVRTLVLDVNFMDSFDTLLDSVRRHEVQEFKSGILDGQNLNGRLTFWQLTFDDVRDAELRARANRIPTTFSIDPESVKAVQQCVDDLVRIDHPKLREILRELRVPPRAGPLEKLVIAPPALSVPSPVASGP